MIEVNDLFKKSVKILNDNNINYWVCHGTLLGIIRDNKLLPWIMILILLYGNMSIQKRTF